MKLFFILCCVIILLLISVPLFAAEFRQVPFIPADKKVLLIVGQDKTSIDDYVHSVGIVPGGTMLYTSVQNADGLESASDIGGGIHHGQYLLDTYPDSVLQVGLWMVDALEGIVTGTYDHNIDILIAWMKKAQRPVFLRIGYEFDFPGNHYDPQMYRQAFQYIVNRFRAAKVENVAFVWHSYANLPKFPWMDWYPGDDFVDWFAISVFGKPNVYMTHFAEMAREHHKGFMIAEATPYGIGTGQGEVSWQDWFVPFFKFIADEQVEIVSYINYDWESIPMFANQGWGDARVQGHPAVKAHWLQEILQDKYIQASSGLFRKLQLKRER
jgi:hypothetical protein